MTHNVKMRGNSHVIEELNAVVLSRTFPSNTGQHLCGLYSSANEPDMIIYAGSCPPAGAEFVRLVIISFSPNEKIFHVQHNVGRAKYVVSYHDGVKKNEDGSPFYDIRIFNNKKKLISFTEGLMKQGYLECKVFKTVEL